jgi:hypothetical protein
MQATAFPQETARVSLGFGNAGVESLRHAIIKILAHPSAPLAASAPRTSSIRRTWTDQSQRTADDRDTLTISWPNYHSGSNGDYQRVSVVEPVHDLLRNPASPSGLIEFFPAHPHEGGVGSRRGLAKQPDALFDLRKATHAFSTHAVGDLKSLFYKWDKPREPSPNND